MDSFSLLDRVFYCSHRNEPDVLRDLGVVRARDKDAARMLQALQRMYCENRVDRVERVSVAILLNVASVRRKFFGSSV